MTYNYYREFDKCFLTVEFGNKIKNRRVARCRIFNSYSNRIFQNSVFLYFIRVSCFVGNEREIWRKFTKNTSVLFEFEKPRTHKTVGWTRTIGVRVEILTEKVARFTGIIIFFQRALPRNWPRALMRPKPQGHASHFKFPAVPCEFLIRVGSTNDRGRSIDSSREMIGEL